MPFSVRVGEYPPNLSVFVKRVFKFELSVSFFYGKDRKSDFQSENMGSTPIRDAKLLKERLYSFYFGSAAKLENSGRL